MNSKLTIVVDAPETPSTTIDDKPAWKAELWVGRRTVGERPKADEAIQAISIGGPGAAVAFALSTYGRRKT